MFKSGVQAMKIKGVFVFFLIFLYIKTWIVCIAFSFFHCGKKTDNMRFTVLTVSKRIGQ